MGEKKYQKLAQHIVTQWEKTGKIGDTGVYNWVSLADAIADCLDNENAVGYRDGYENAARVMAHLAK